MKSKIFIFRSLLLIFHKHVGNSIKQNYMKEKKRRRKASYFGNSRSYPVQALKINETESTLWSLQQS